MDTYLFAWNPARWEWDDLDESLARVKKRGYVDERWSCARRKVLPIGSRALLIRLGPKKPTGIVGVGTTTSDPYEDVHYSDRRKKSQYVDIRWHDLRREPLIGWAELQKAPFLGFRWGIQASGTTVAPELAVRLQKVWDARAGVQSPPLAEELPEGRKFTEGAKKTITVNAYERDNGARAACLAKYGYACTVCDVVLEEKYGAIAREFIHVHHVTPIAKIGKAYEVDPLLDLRPVCPTCHAILHRKDPPMTIEAARRLVRR